MTKQQKKKSEKCVTTLTININKIENDDCIKRISNKDITRFMNQLTPQEEYKLASDLAAALGEPNNVDYYLKFTPIIPKEYLLEKLAYVLSKPQGEIDNKAAYFNSILKSYGRKERRYSRH